MRSYFEVAVDSAGSGSGSQGQRLGRALHKACRESRSAVTPDQMRNSRLAQSSLTWLCCSRPLGPLRLRMIHDINDKRGSSTSAADGLARRALGRDPRTPTPAVIERAAARCAPYSDVLRASLHALIVAPCGQLLGDLLRTRVTLRSAPTGASPRRVPLLRRRRLREANRGPTSCENLDTMLAKAPLIGLDARTCAGNGPGCLPRTPRSTPPIRPRAQPRARSAWPDGAEGGASRPAVAGR